MNALFPDMETYKLFSDCLNKACETVSILNKIKQKRKAMNSKDNAPISNFEWTDELVKEFYEKWHGDRHYNEVIKDLLPKAISNFKSQHSSSGRYWEITKVIHKGAISFFSTGRGYTLDEIQKDGHSIYEVRRLVDGEVFRIGDVLVKYGTIESFKIQSGKNLLAKCNDGQEPLSHVFLEDCKKAPIPPPKPVLFTTEDGVPVFDIDQDLYWVLATGDWKTECSMLPANVNNYNKTWKAFSTAEARAEYVLQNRPVLSLSDIEKCMKHEDAMGYKWGFLDSDKLKALAKSKITP
jgi:hypothetical protein